MQQEKTELLARAGELVNRGLKNNEQKAEYKRLLTESDRLAEDIAMFQTIDSGLRNTAPKPAVSPEVAALFSPEQRKANTNAAWRTWFKSGYSDAIPEHRDLLSSSDDTGGALVPEDMATDFYSSALKYYFPAAQYVRTRWTDNSHPVKISRVDDRNSGLYLISEGSGPSEVDPTDFSSSVLTYDQFSTGEVIFANELLQDSAFDLVDFLTDLASIRFGRGLAQIVTNGSDTASSATPNNIGMVNIASTGTSTSVLANGISWTDITNLYESLDTAFLPKAIWQMNTTTRLALLQQKDSTGRPFYTPAPTVNDFDMLLGRPVVINNALTGNPTTANSAPILFGDLYNGVQMTIRRLRSRVLRERYADIYSSALLTYTGVASTALAPGALQKLVMAAS
jgi:HK97 family phage major capsid protein